MSADKPMCDDDIIADLRREVFQLKQDKRVMRAKHFSELAELKNRITGLEAFKTWALTKPETRQTL
jgi:hypothetical protein